MSLRGPLFTKNMTVQWQARHDDEKVDVIPMKLSFSMSPKGDQGDHVTPRAMPDYPFDGVLGKPSLPDHRIHLVKSGPLKLCMS